MPPLKRHWRSLEELLDSMPQPLLSSPINRGEFPEGASEGAFNRREFLKIMAASLALAGVSACTRQPTERILPYVRQPEEIVPGEPLFFATALSQSGFARGILVETHEGRPTKIEGNPDHPASLGASDVFMQAELLTLFDPDRSHSVFHLGQIGTWEELLGELASETGTWKRTGGKGVAILTRHETSPTFLDQISRFLGRYPAAGWYEYEPIPVRPNRTRYHFDKAEVILALEADFLSCGPSSLADSRQFALKRRSDSMNRLYVLESTPTLTGAMADHRFPLAPEQIAAFVSELASGKPKNPIASRILADLRRSAGKSLVLAGESLPDFVQEVVQQINSDLGNIGATVSYATSAGGGDFQNAQPYPAKAQAIGSLVDEMKTGKIETLIIIGGNPVYDAPADYEFERLLSEIPRSIHLGLYRDETAVRCKWHVPEAHSLESWGDLEAFDGTQSILQPVIAPLYGGISRLELLAALLEEPPAGSHEIVRSYWLHQHSEQNFEEFWRKSLHLGTVGGASGQVSTNAAPPPNTPASQSGDRSNKNKTQAGLHLLIRPSLQVYDGKYSNNAWLQEFPDPITKLVWDNASLISPTTAALLNLRSGERVRLKFKGRTVIAPLWIVPGQADNCVTIHLGYGRSNAGTVGNGIGFNAYALRTSDALWGGPGLEIERIDSTEPQEQLVTTQQHWNMEGRGQVRVGTKAQYSKNPQAIITEDEPPPRRGESLYRNYQYTSPAWGMVIDLNTCIGCGACTIACQAENNIPVVGKEQVAVHREMHWIRVDRYYEGEPRNPRTLHQPVPCMHCETAPCELVCPVAATVHSGEGLNQMVYNRCIGTRYCSNNCPYKVRRFNFLEYDANEYERPETRKLMRNPNVTVRTRGVMEKCTYCIQRISAARILAHKEDRPIRDGEIIPACAQVCPADAIIFGDVADPGSRVARMKASPVNYGLLAELNTRPRTTYLAKLRNPNPELEADENAVG